MSDKVKTMLKKLHDVPCTVTWPRHDKQDIGLNLLDLADQLDNMRIYGKLKPLSYHSRREYRNSPLTMKMRAKAYMMSNCHFAADYDGNTMVTPKIFRNVKY